MRLFFAALVYLVIVPVYGQVKYARGYIFNQEEYEEVPHKALLIRGDYKELPDKASLKKYCPKPGNQLQLQTSTNWAITYGALTIMEAINNDWTDISTITKNAYSPVFNYSVSTQLESKNCSEPISLVKALDALKNFGTPKYVEFQEFCPKSIPDTVYILAKENKITDFLRLFEPQDPPEKKLEAVKKALSENMPVVTGMICPPSFFIAEEFWQPREDRIDAYEGHALVVVGYDDSKYGGAFEVLNSWGSNWGNEGYIWIRYPDFLEFTKSAFELFVIRHENQNTIDFSGEIKLVLADGTFIETELDNNKGYYKTTQPYGAGTDFRIYITNNKTAYIYVFGTDLTNEYFKLFPYHDDISPVLNYKESSVALPSEKHHIQITGDPGKNFLVILYSKEEIPFDNLLKELKKRNGRIDDRLNEIMGDYIVDQRNIHWETESIKFSGKGNGKTLLPVFIELEHN